MPTEVVATPRADQQIASLTRRQTTALDQFLNELAAQGCAALAYRLTGTPPLNHLCVKHLTGDLRVVVAFETDERAWILLVGSHIDADPGLDVYTELYRLIDVEPPDGEGRRKPPCSGPPPDSLPPTIGDSLTDILDRARRTRRTRS